MHLTNRRFHRLHAALQQLRAPVSLETFPQHALSALAKLVPADVSAYNEVNLQTRQMYIVGVPDELRFPGDVAVWLQHMHEHPLLTYMQSTGDGSAKKIADFLTQGQFRRSTLYNEVYRRLHGEHQIAVSLELPSPQVIAFAFNRRSKDFSEQEREVLNLLRPHLTQAYLQAETVEQLRRDMTVLQCALDVLDRGVVILTMDGRVQVVTLQARQWLQEYFAPASVFQSSPLPDRVWQWVRTYLRAHSTRALTPVPDSLTMERQESTLTIRCLVEPEAKRVLLLFQEQRRDLCPATLAPLGLSKRECDILYWVMQGKTNPEIGAILGLSPNTVRTRLEDLFLKLGVKTRTAAAMRARELIAQLTQQSI